MSWRNQSRFVSSWFRRDGLGLGCRSFCRNKTMASDSDHALTGSAIDGDKEREGEELARPVSKSQLFSFLRFVRVEKLSAREKLVHARHLESLENGEDTYKDPVTGYDVFTRLAHLRRGVCCGSACRHCPYGHKEVPADKKTKMYNSAFYV